LQTLNFVAGVIAAITGVVHSVVSGGSAAAYLAASALVLVGTRGRHPGWIALLMVAVLIGVHWLHPEGRYRPFTRRG